MLVRLKDKTKAKLSWHKHDKDFEKTPEPATAPTLIKPQIGESESKPAQSAASTEQEPAESSTTLVDKVPPVEESNSKDYWREALKTLSPEEYGILMQLGLDRLKSQPAEATLNELKGTVEKRQKDCEEKFWRISVGGKTIVLRDYTTAIIDWIQQAGDIAVQFAPAPGQLVWSIIENVLQIPVNESEQMAALLGITEKIVPIVIRGRVYEQLYLQTAGLELDAVAANLECGLIKIYATSLRLLAEAGTLLSKNTTQRILEAIVHPGKATDALLDISEQERQLMRDVEVCQSKRIKDDADRMNGMLETLGAPVNRADKGIAHLLESIDDDTRIKMLEWISPIYFGKFHRRVKDKRTPGTGEWILQHACFREWERKRESKLFWLQGSPGAGKTYLTASVIDHIKDLLRDPPGDEGFAYFYCDRSSPSTTQPLSVLQSFVRQLSTTQNYPESMRTKLKKAYITAREEGADFHFEQCKEQILESLNAYSRTILVIDAMDECDPETRGELIDTLKTFISDSTNTVKVFISSRPDPKIQSRLKSTPNVAISTSDNQDDIEKFLRSKFDDFAKDGSKQAIVRLRDKILQKLLEKCQGMFQWAAMQIHQIGMCTTDSSIEEALDDLPKDLREVYDEIWSQIEALRETDRNLAKRAFRWIMASLVPLEIWNLLTAIRVGQDGDILSIGDSADEDSLMVLCRNFIVIDPMSYECRFSHLSVIEFLEEKDGWTLPWAHHHAATACLSYFIKSYSSSTRHSESQIAGSKSKVEAQLDNPPPGKLSFHSYMRFFWIKHVKQAQDTNEKSLSYLLKTFLGPPDESSDQYREWYRQAETDFSEWQKPWAVHDMIIDGEEPSKIYRKLSPANFSIFAMVRFAFTETLQDWRGRTKSSLWLTNDMGQTPLLLACENGFRKVCHVLIDAGADVNLRSEGESGGCAVVIAAANGHLEAVKYLVESGADANMLLEEREGLYDNALSAAIESGDVETVKYLLRNTKFDINMYLPKSYHGYAIGQAAALTGIDILKVILAAGANVNQLLKFQHHPTVLLLKISSGELESVKYLVEEAEADINVPFRSEYYDNILIFACDIYHGQERRDCAQCLLNAGADINMPLPSARNGSLLANIAFDNDLDTTKLLVEAGAEVNMVLEVGRFGSALAAAVSSTYVDCYDIVVYLIHAEADVNMPLRYGKVGSALEAAVWKLRYNIMEVLITAGADVNMYLENHDFGTVVALAAALPDGQKAVRYLVEAGGDINPKGPVGKYGGPLIAAACFGQRQTVEYLIEKGADVNQRFEGIPFPTPLQAAQNDLSKEEFEWADEFQWCRGAEAEIMMDEKLKSWIKEQRVEIVELLKRNGAIA